MHIPVKSGRLATGAYGESSPIRGEAFPTSTQPHLTPATVGGISMPDDRKTTVYGNPLATLRNISRQRDVKALTSYNNVYLMSPASVPLIQPQERGTFFFHKPTPIDKTQFGASGEKSSDTSFHPTKKFVVLPPTPRSAREGEKTSAASFLSLNNNWYDPNNSFVNGKDAPASGATGGGRWNTVKRGVV